jgi:hypothetical protein
MPNVEIYKTVRIILILLNLFVLIIIMMLPFYSISINLTENKNLGFGYILIFIIIGILEILMFEIFLSRLSLSFIKITHELLVVGVVGYFLRSIVCQFHVIHSTI